MVLADFSDVECLMNSLTQWGTCTFYSFLCRYGKERKNAALAHLTANINARGVRGGHFELPVDPKGQLGDLSLNKSQAYTILAPLEDFQGKHYNNILDNVCFWSLFSPLYTCIYIKLGHKSSYGLCLLVTVVAVAMICRLLKGKVAIHECLHMLMSFHLNFASAFT